MANDILDADVLADREFALRKGELMIWKGEPKPYFSISMAEVLVRDANVSAAAVLQFVMSLILICKVVYLVDGSDNVKSTVITALLLLIVMVPDVLRHIRKANTQYYLTTERVVIKTLYYLQKQQYTLELVDIMDVSYEGYKDGYGTLFLQMVRVGRRKTYDFFTGARRHFPTLELVSDYAAVKRQIDTLRSED